MSYKISIYMEDYAVIDSILRHIYHSDIQVLFKSIDDFPSILDTTVRSVLFCNNGMYYYIYMNKMEMLILILPKTLHINKGDQLGKPVIYPETINKALEFDIEARI